MKQTKRFLLVLTALAMAACDDLGDSYKTVDYDLHGAWERTEQNYWYGGELALDIDTITISGSFAYLRGFTRGVALEAYTETVESGSSQWKGLLFIKDKGAWQSPVPFTWWKTGGSLPDKMLTFTGGSSDETLKRIGDEQ
ncbi:MAG: hypothetical protein LBQ67_06895 [Treponema sp.]|nr:hypothetical protein [Treponema sp.]